MTNRSALTLLLLASPAAEAADDGLVLTLGAHGLCGLGSAEASIDPRCGLGAAVNVGRGRLRLGGVAEAALDPSLAIRPEVALAISPVGSPDGVAWALGGAGVRVGGGADPAPIGALGVGLDLPLAGDWLAQVQARYLLEREDSLQLSIGIAAGRRGEGAAPAAPALTYGAGALRCEPSASTEGEIAWYVNEVLVPGQIGLTLPASHFSGGDAVYCQHLDPETGRPSAPSAQLLIAESGERLVWVPHPICEWLPESEAAALLERDVIAEMGDDHLRLHADGAMDAFSPAASGREALAEAAAQPILSAPPRGGVVVIGQPGDRVTLLDAEGGVLEGISDQPIDARGILARNVPEAPLYARVVGGGREETLSAEIEAGLGVWLRASPPETTSVGFALDSDALDPDALAAIQGIADRAGGYAFRLRGAYSLEGGDREYNWALAMRRAEAVDAALQAAGVPADRIYVFPPVVDEAECSEDQSCEYGRRVCSIQPLRPEEAP